MSPLILQFDHDRICTVVQYLVWSPWTPAPVVYLTTCVWYDYPLSCSLIARVHARVDVTQHFLETNRPKACTSTVCGLGVVPNSCTHESLSLQCTEFSE